MNKVFNTYRPEGFETANGYLFAENPKELIDFLKNAFYAEEINRSTNPENDDIANVINATARRQCKCRISILAIKFMLIFHFSELISILNWCKSCNFSKNISKCFCIRIPYIKHDF